MAKNAVSHRFTDNLLQVAGFLRQADRLVRERNYSLALEQIAKARAKDPTNSYAEAYEQRVRLLLGALNEKKQARSGPYLVDSSTPHAFSEHLESIANLAIREAHRTANISAQQSLDRQQGDPKLSATNSSAQALKIEMEESEGKEEQIRQCVRSAENLLRDQKLDEAQNMLVPAIVLDPLNDGILRLERRIRAAQEEKWLDRVRQSQSHVEQTQTARRGNDWEIQKYVLEAVHLAERKEFSEALMVLGQGYLLDPFNASLAMCEKTILAGIERENSGAESRPASIGVTTTDGDSESSAAKRSVLQYLDQAEEYLSHDRFPEALSQVASAIIAVQLEKGSEEDKLEMPTQVRIAHREFTDSGTEDVSTDQWPGDESRQIFKLLDEAKKLANKAEFGVALEVLLQASSLTPSDGSLQALEREIGRKFMEYFQLMQVGGSLRPIKDRELPGSTVVPPSLDSGSAQISNALPHSRTVILNAERSPSDVSGRQLQFEIPPAYIPDDRISQIRGHLLRSLRHLNNMRLVEASVEGEIASLVDSSRRDVNSFAQAVAGLSRKAKARIPLNTMSEQYEAIRQQAKDLVYTLWYEEIRNGVDRVLESLPANTIMQKDRGEIEDAFEEFKRSTGSDTNTKTVSLESARRTPAAARKTRKQSFDQIGLSFSIDSDHDAETFENRSSDASDSMEGLPIHKPMRRASSASSEATYLGN